MIIRRTPALVLALLMAAVTATGVTAAQEAPQVPASAPCAPGAVYDPACDVDHDGDVDVLDIQLAAGHWNQTGVWTGGDYWSLTGNAGTTPGTHFLGTTDNQPLDLRVAGQRALHLEPGQASPNLVGGYSGNSVTSGVAGATISGGGQFGYENHVYDGFGTIGGGDGNVAGNDADPNPDGDRFATVAGGQDNAATSAYAVVGGGQGNSALSDNATVGGGWLNTASDRFATVGGGVENTASGESATVSGGLQNAAIGWWSVVGGGYGNHANLNYGTISGGLNNSTTGTYSTIGGGKDNTVSVDGWAATIAGGSDNNAAGYNAAVGGGTDNTANGDFATVGGGYQNVAYGEGSTVGGGKFNDAPGTNATIGGGANNIAMHTFATIPGGSGARADHYGEMAYASGSFAAAGDAQTSLYVLRRETGDATLSELFLNGWSDRITLATDRVMTFDILVVASHRFGGGSSAGYQVAGVIRNIGGVTAFVGTPVTTVLGENVAGWNVQVEADDALDALLVKVQGSNGTTIRWVASVRTVEVAR